MIGVGNLPEKNRLSWYQSIAKKNTSGFMLYLMVGCLSRSQEKASPRNMGLFPNGGV
jgi:hypothetical protein